MAKRKPDEPPKGAPAWQSTFADLMNLLLCFFVLLFSMSTIDAEKWEEVVASFANTISIFDGGASAIGDGILISNGVSQLNELSEYINTTGQAQDIEDPEELTLYEEIKQEGLSESEQMAEQIEEALNEMNMEGDVDIDFTSQYVLLTMKGAILFDSGSAQLKEGIYPTLNNLAKILLTYSDSLIEIEGHTDNVPIHSRQYANNDELSDARALSVFQYFISTTTLDPATIKHSGRGEYVPIADNSTEEGRGKNRRVEIKIYNTLNSEER
ncbi:MAG: flagellar motor protein MotB [Lachnospiraceae bacterium]|nr:flagellar motor protein MotB [Candidatus Merdinaster equi]